MLQESRKKFDNNLKMLIHCNLTLRINRKNIYREVDIIVILIEIDANHVEK